GPVWGNTKGEFRTEEEQNELLGRIKNVLSLSSIFQKA
ncbi:HIT family protein, partial [Vibrio parahaemolyticus]|nr:HIT family protein [Vibrio parahaemolyticus]